MFRYLNSPKHAYSTSYMEFPFSELSVLTVTLDLVRNNFGVQINRVAVGTGPGREITRRLHFGERMIIETVRGSLYIPQMI